MAPGAEADALYLERSLALIQLVREEVEQLSEAEFLHDRNLKDATALRLGTIGEFSRKLSAELRERHPQIDWRGMARLRNIVAHHYDRLDYSRIWIVATQAMGALETACALELRGNQP